MAQRKKLLRVSWTPRAPLAGHSWIMFDFGSSPSVSLLLWVYISICCKSNITCVIYIIQGSSMQNDHLSVRRPFCFNTQPPNSVWYPSPSIEIKWSWVQARPPSFEADFWVYDSIPSTAAHSYRSKRSKHANLSSRAAALISWKKHGSNNQDVWNILNFRGYHVTVVRE